MEQLVNSTLPTPVNRGGRPKGSKDKLRLSLREKAHECCDEALTVLRELAKTATNENIRLTASLAILAMSSHKRPIVLPNTRVKWGS